MGNLNIKKLLKFVLYFFGVLLIIGILGNWFFPIILCILLVLYIKKKREKQEDPALIQERISSLKQNSELLKVGYTNLFADSLSLIEINSVNVWKNQANAFIKEVAALRKMRRLTSSSLSELFASSDIYEEYLRNMAKKVSQHNDTVWENRINKAYAVIGDVEGRKLDKQQMKCIIKEAQSHLVVAGAGTGKTTTIIGKIKYLLKTEKCLPEDILVLSFTNASAKEMRERIQKETGHPIAAMTFHKLGLGILTKVNGVVPRITNINMRTFVKEQLAINVQDPVYLQKLSRYLLFGRIVDKSEFTFNSKEEYEEWILQNPPTTAKGERVKSYGEMVIANFLLQHGIAYVYEHPYEEDTRTDRYGQYYPDFYLPEHKIYIEYFGVNRAGEVPPYFEGKDGKDATTNYQEGMSWKRALHKEQGTRLIECYAYEHLENILEENLKKRLEEASVTCSPKEPSLIWQELASQTEQDSAMDGLVELFETVISLLKSNGYDIIKLKELCGQHLIYRHINLILVDLLEPIYAAYCNKLKATGEIDFSDMINEAAAYVRAGKFQNPFRYVIVDEYQDISKARFKLLESLRCSRYYDLFCVGDDWQSIYRFAGSDISYILNFQKYWGPSEISRIETTYRFAQKLIEISGNFVMQNPAQIKKSIKGKDDNGIFPMGEIVGYTEPTAVRFIDDKLKDIPAGSTVFFIGRYTFDSKMLTDSGIFQLRYDNVNGVTKVVSDKYRNLDITFLTAHKSKGLQADYVFIINNKNSRMGFPSKIMDAPLISLLLDSTENYPYAEERRLFYVALTRAKKKVFLLAISGKTGIFFDELKKTYEKELKKEHFSCPLCGGQLSKRTGKYGEFYGCVNYKSTGCTYTRNIATVPKAVQPASENTES